MTQNVLQSMGGRLQFLRNYLFNKTRLACVRLPGFQKGTSMLAFWSLFFMMIILPACALPVTSDNSTSNTNGTVNAIPELDEISDNLSGIKPETNQTGDILSPVIPGKLPGTDSERQQFTDDLRKKGYSDKEIAAEILKQIHSVPASAIVVGERADTKGPKMSATEIQKEMLDLNIDVIDPGVKNASPLYILLILRDYQKQNILSDIDVSKIDPSLKEELKKSLKDIWIKYPVNFSTKGNRTTIGFNLEKKDVTLSPGENKILEAVDEIHLKKLVSTSNLSVKWAGAPGHAEFIQFAVLQNTLSAHPMHGYAYTARTHAGDPDLNIPWNLLDHYYNPDLSTGWAPQRAYETYNYAKIFFNSQSYESSAIAIAHASHYLTDVGNPFHTGHEWDTFWNQTTHERYESWVASRWDTSPFYFGHYAREHYYDFLGVGNPSDSTVQVAQYSHPYLETLWTKFYSDSDEQLENDEWVTIVTRDCIDTTGRYTYGMVDNLLLTTFPQESYYPTDINQDNLYEDFNGNNRVDYSDVLNYYNNMHWIESSQPFRLFDYNRNGAIDFADVTDLYDMI